jgi:hypothetical protein
MNNIYQNEMKRFEKKYFSNEGDNNIYKHKGKFYIHQLEHMRIETNKLFSCMPSYSTIYYAVLSISNRYNNQKTNVLVDENINKILKLYGFDFRFSEKFIDYVKNIFKFNNKE